MFSKLAVRAGTNSWPAVIVYIVNLPNARNSDRVGLSEKIDRSHIDAWINVPNVSMRNFERRVNASSLAPASGIESIGRKANSTASTGCCMESRWTGPWSGNWWPMSVPSVQTTFPRT